MNLNSKVDEIKVGLQLAKKTLRNAQGSRNKIYRMIEEMQSKYESMRDFYDSRIEELKKENAEMTSRITSATDVTNCSEKCATTKQEKIEKPNENCLKLEIANRNDGTDTTRKRRVIRRNEENINDKDLKEEVEIIAMKAELNKKEMKNFKISVTSVSEIIQLLTPADKE